MSAPSPSPPATPPRPPTASAPRFDHRGAVQALPLVAMVLVAALLGVFLWTLHRSETEEETRALIKNTLWAEQNLTFMLSADEDKLRHLADTLGREAGVEGWRSPLSGEADWPPAVLPAIRHLLTAETALVRVVWLGPQGEARLAMPPRDDAASTVQGTAARQDAIHMARSLGRHQYSAPYPLPEGDHGFDLVMPVYAGGRFAGVLIGVFSVRGFLAEHVPWWFTEHYQLEILDASGVVLGAKTRVVIPPPRLSHTVLLDPPGKGLTLVATAHPRESSLGRTVLVGAIFALSASALWSLWALRRHVRRRVAAEHALRAEYAFRKAMEDSLTVGMRARDLDGRVTYVNPAFCRMVGWPAEDLIGAGPAMPYWVPEEMDKTQAAFRRVLAGKAPPDGFELRFQRRNGERFDALVYEAPLIDADGRHTGWMSSVLDITERRAAQELARQQHESLQQTARLISMGEMASTLAHELSQPLAAIAGYATGCLNLLRGGSGGAADLEPALEKLTRQARRAGEILRHVHDFVRKREPEVGPCDLKEVVEASVDLFRADARKHGIAVDLVRRVAVPPVLADGVLIQQVLLNLMRNGCEAMQKTPAPNRRLTVEVTTAKDGSGGVLVLVSDRGAGIAPEALEHLFTPFHTTKPGGMGMGLNICRSIIETHRGRLWTTPNPGGGTVFLFTLPPAQAVALETTAA